MGVGVNDVGVFRGGLGKLRIFPTCQERGVVVSVPLGKSEKTREITFVLGSVAGRGAALRARSVGQRSRLNE